VSLVGGNQLLDQTLAHELYHGMQAISPGLGMNLPLASREAVFNPNLLEDEAYTFGLSILQDLYPQ
jgi:hypothetical protein